MKEEFESCLYTFMIEAFVSLFENTELESLQDMQKFKKGVFMSPQIGFT